ncbi:MAG TPA: Ig-like domain repeat protein [Nocardioides sp.]|nr:Ig-like domain repeat protein [Nocardioides sp.]
MRVLHLSHRMAATGIATALAAGALVAGTATTADAAVTGGATYTCTTSLGPADLDVAVSSLAMPTTGIAAGSTIPGGLLPVTVDLTLPATLVGGLAGLLNITAISGTAPDFKMLLGATDVPIDGISAPLTTLPVPAAPMVLSSTGTVHSFVTPAAGTYDISLPDEFTLNPTQQSGIALPALPCTIKDPAAKNIGTATVVKNDSTTAAKPAVTPFHKGKAAKMKVTVNAAHTPSGNVLIKEGTKTLGKGTLSSLGKIVINMGSKLAVGKHNVVVSYKGDGYTNTSKKSLTFKVVR